MAGILGQSGSDPQLQEVTLRLVYPWTHSRFMAYVTASAEVGVGGHCYGMSATSAEYFLGNLSRPGGVGATAALKQEQASFNIALYHRAQLRSVMEGALTGTSFVPDTWGVQKAVDDLRASLRDQRKPLVISFFGKVAVPGKPGEFTRPAHAVLGYKMVDWGRDKYCVYVYDSNFEPNSFLLDAPMPYFTFDTSSGQWAFPLYMPYSWIVPSWLSAVPPQRTIPPRS